MKKTLVVNLFAGPGVGKTTMASLIFSSLKQQHYVCELAQEVAKDLVWEENKVRISNQVLVLGEQFHNIYKVLGKVDVVVVDSPILLSLIYGREWLPSSFRPFVIDLFNTCNNLNYFVERVDFGQFEQEGRVHNLEESLEKDQQIKDLLDSVGVAYNTVMAGNPPITDVLQTLWTQKDS